MFGLLRRLAQVTAGRVTSTAQPRPDQPELRISELITAGFSNKEIARQLNICLSTTKSHVHNLLRKLNLLRRDQVGARTPGTAQPTSFHTGTPAT